MNLRRRVSISRVAFWVIRVRLQCWLLILGLVHTLCNLMIALDKRKSHYRVEALKKDVASWTARVNSSCAGCQAVSQEGDRQTEVNRQGLLATQSALLAERERLQATIAELKSPHPIRGAAVLTYGLVSVRDGVFRTQRKREAFSRILSEIENSPNFYWDLLLWLVIPISYSEELLGDLAEEYQLRNATEGEALARAWYGHQVITTLRGWFRKRIERLAAVGTLIDLIDRWFRK